MNLQDALDENREVRREVSHYLADREGECYSCKRFGYVWWRCPASHSPENRKKSEMRKKACPTLGPDCRGCPDCQGIPFDAETDAWATEELAQLPDEEPEDV